MKIRALGDDPYNASGYSNNLVQMFYALQQLGHDAKIIAPPQSTNSMKVQAVAQDVDDIDKDTVCLVRAYNAELLYSAKQKAKAIATILVLEGDKIPEAWIPVANSADMVWASSDYNKEMLIKNGVVPDLIHVVHHGVDTDIFYPESESNE